MVMSHLIGYDFLHFNKNFVCDIFPRPIHKIMAILIATLKMHYVTGFHEHYQKDSILVYSKSTLNY